MKSLLATSLALAVVRLILYRNHKTIKNGSMKCWMLINRPWRHVDNPICAWMSLELSKLKFILRNATLNIQIQIKDKALERILQLELVKVQVNLHKDGFIRNQVILMELI